MEYELAAVDAGEEIAAEPWKERRHADAREKKNGDENGPSAYECPQQLEVSVANPLESTVECLLHSYQRVARRCSIVIGHLQQIHRHGRHERSRQNIRGQHGEDDRLCKRREQIM